MYKISMMFRKKRQHFSKKIKFSEFRENIIAQNVTNVNSSLMLIFSNIKYKNNNFKLNIKKILN